MDSFATRLLALALLCCAGPINAGGLVEFEFDLASFSTPLAIDNPYWPLVPDRRIVYLEVAEDECVINDFLVTDQAKEDFQGAYAGLAARVILDREWLDEDCDGGRDVLLEDTFDWYAQDDAGNVWYLGEDTIEYLFDEEGNPIGSTTEGSWEAGVDGAIAGVIMLAEPTNGDFYRQEFYAGVAEDAAKIIGTGRNVSIGLGDFSNCLTTKEWSPLSPGTIEHKHYCPDVGLVSIEALGGKTEITEAVDLGLP